MSDSEEESLEELGNKIQKVFDDYFSEKGGFTNGWVAMADGIGEEGARRWVYKTGSNQSLPMSLGLIQLARVNAEEFALSAFECTCEEDDD